MTAHSTQSKRAAARRQEGKKRFRETGVAWLGQIPARWELRPLKRLVRIVGGGTPPKDNPENWNGDLPWVSPKDMKVQLIQDTEDHISERALRESATNLVPAGTVLIVVRSGILAHSIPVAVAGRPVALNQDLKGFIPTPDIVPEYLMYVIAGMQRELLFEWKKEGATVESLELDLIASTPLPVPDVAEQRAIAAFLDRETARIDALVAKKELLIELLQDELGSLIARTVTVGLDRDVPMKDSGVEELGKIPRQWNVKRLWHLSPTYRRIMYGIVLPGPDVDDGVPIVKGGDVSPARLKLASLSRTTFEIESSYARSRLRNGDLVYAIRGSIGEVAMVPAELEGANLTQDAARVSYTGATHGPWLLFVLKSLGVFAQLEAGALGATIRGINIRDLKRAPIAVPPYDEQVTIAGFLEREAARIDSLTRKVGEAIVRLNELRTALVSAAVTGKIDVRGAA